MFAILIGFSFSMAMNLFELRRALLLDEANAIETGVAHAFDNLIGRTRQARIEAADRTGRRQRR